MPSFFIPRKDAKVRCILTSAVETKGLSKHYGDTIALDHLDLKIEKGQVYGLLGGRNAGKSTILRVLSTLLKPDGGTALVNGFDILEEDVKVRETIGIAFEGNGIYSRMTPRENLKFFGNLHDMKGEDLSESVGSLIQAFNLQKEADQSARTLNDAQKRRLTIACASVHKPALLMIDIQTSDLDMVTNRLIDSFLTGYAQEGRTVIKTTRSLVESRLLCKKMAILRNGFLVASGSLADIEQVAGESGLREALTELDLVGA